MTRLFVMCAVVGTGAGADILNVPGDFETIQAAIDARSDGDEIVVAPGTYNEALFAETVPGSGIPRKVFTLRSSTRNPADVIIDASMPVVVRDSGCMWTPGNKLKEVKCCIPDRCYAGVYQSVFDFCRANGQFDAGNQNLHYFTTVI